MTRTELLERVTEAMERAVQRQHTHRAYDSLTGRQGVVELDPDTAFEVVRVLAEQP